MTLFIEKDAQPARPQVTIINKQISIAENVIDNAFYLVTKGLEAGQLIVTEKPSYINEKQPVQIQIEESLLPKRISVIPEQRLGDK